MDRTMDEVHVRMINLLECLSEDHPEVTPPSDNELATWSESELREYFTSGVRPEQRDASVAGGARQQTVDARSCTDNLPEFDRSRLTADNYRRVAFENGIPFRPDGLFPIGDELLTALSHDNTLRPFQKNCIGCGGDFVKAESWATGNLAARRGLDLRYFYRAEGDSGVPLGELVGAFRLGAQAGIGYHLFTSAHGGSIETVLDETTAEIVKVAVAPNVATVEIVVKIKKAVQLNHTYRVDCIISKNTPFRIYSDAIISDPTDGTVFATATACLANLEEIKRQTEPR